MISKLLLFSQPADDIYYVGRAVLDVSSGCDRILDSDSCLSG